MKTFTHKLTDDTQQQDQCGWSTAKTNRVVHIIKDEQEVSDTVANELSEAGRNKPLSILPLAFASIWSTEPVDARDEGERT